MNKYTEFQQIITRRVQLETAMVKYLEALGYGVQEAQVPQAQGYAGEASAGGGNERA